jgi:MYXO-CTERM domain-containing protein
MRAAALASGARANGTLANANANGELVELKYVLNEETGRLELQKPANLNASLAEAVRSGLIASAFETGSAPVTVQVHDLEVDHRVYRGPGGERWLDIIVRNHAATREGMKLVCAVYVDGAKEPEYINLPCYDNAPLGHRTQTISLPVSALVDDPGTHSRVRVEIMSVDGDERALANNEFTVILGGNGALRFVKQPEDVTVQEGEDVSFEVEVAGGAKPYTYQWQVWDPVHGKWVDLPGFTDPVLRREDIEKKWDGARFRCVVTDANGTQAVSEEATLTVRDGVPTGDSSNLPLYAVIALAALALLWALRRRSANGAR